MILFVEKFAFCAGTTLSFSSVERRRPNGNVFIFHLLLGFIFIYFFVPNLILRAEQIADSDCIMDCESFYVWRGERASGLLPVLAHE